MTQQSKHHTKAAEALVHAYGRMLERSKHILHEAKEETGPLVQRSVQAAREKAVELGELTREEAEKVSDYIIRDLHDAAEYLATQERELADWLRLDLLLVEQNLLDKFSILADQTRLELDDFAKTAAIVGEWHTGEVTGLGTLTCVECGQLIHFEKPSHIPPCPKCHGTVFNRPIS